ncbi:aminotransferase class V-fold PLP-dependent enzyme [Niabella hirudinis]|uniref:aminotransferase class V-fold PLP-dependent enzyme n=1 Tax=Niabella hirudinis TaxID=1285929 RepID=UPI003EB875CD
MTSYLNTAGCGLIPPSVSAAGTQLYQGFEQNSSAAAEHWRDVEVLQIKKNVAAFMGAAPGNIALVPNFSHALNSIVQALTGQEKILLYKKDFPSVYAPFVINNFNIVWIDDTDGFTIDLNQIASIIKKQQIDIIAISHVQWHSGFRLDLGDLCSICRQHQALSIIDATQSLGAMELQIPEIQPDVLIASNYKWMNAGFGNGILYMNDAFAQRYPAKINGFNSGTLRMTETGFSFDRGIANYEPGSLNMLGFTLLNKAIEEKNKTGLAYIEAHNTGLAKLLLHHISGLPVTLVGPAAWENRCSILVLKDERGLHQRLTQNNIVTTGRNGMVRISIHYYNTEADIQMLVSCLSL